MSNSTYKTQHNNLSVIVSTAHEYIGAHIKLCGGTELISTHSKYAGDVLQFCVCVYKKCTCSLHVYMEYA